MTSKERVNASLHHKQPDRVAMDLGGHVCTMLNATCVAGLRDYYGLEKRPVTVYDTATMVGLVEEDLLDAMGADCEPMAGYDLSFGLKNTGRLKEWTYRGVDVWVPETFEISDDGAGGFYVYPQGDRAVPPSGHMPANGFYFDDVVRQPPIDEERMDYHDNLEEYAPVTDDALAFYAREAKRHRGSKRAVIFNPGGAALGDFSQIAGNGLKHPRGIRNIPDLLTAPYLYPEYLHEMFSHQADRMIENWSKLHAAVGDTADVAYMCGADFGTQISQFCSLETFDEFYAPYYKRMNDWVHQNTNWKTLKHCCGAIVPFIPRLIDAGFDALNPVQCSAAGMDPALLKAEYGERITFWGGGVDTQKCLPFGTPEEVRRQVLERCEIFAGGGGFIFGAIHIVQCNTPVRNIVAMIDAVHEFNGERR